MTEFWSLPDYDTLTFSNNNCKFLNLFVKYTFNIQFYLAISCKLIFFSPIRNSLLMNGESFPNLYESVTKSVKFNSTLWVKVEILR